MITTYVNKLTDLLRDDLNQHGGDYDAWAECVTDCPSDDVVQYMKSVPEALHDDVWCQALDNMKPD